MTTSAIVFSGHPGGEDELTWGQRYIWQIIEALAPHDTHLNMFLTIEIPGGRPVAEVVAHLAGLMAQAGTLRTVYPRDAAGTPRQRLLAEGSAPLTTREVASAADAGDCLHRLTAELSAERFVLESGPVVRWGLVTHDGTALGIAVGLSHMVVDGAGARLLEAAIRSLWENDGTASEPDRWQPFDQLAFERSEAGTKINERSLDYWRRQLADAPLVREDPVVRRPEQQRYWHGYLHSTALDLASALVGSRFCVSSNTVLLAAAGTVLGHLLDVPDLLLVTRISNRLTDAAQLSISHLSQAAPIRFAAAAGFQEMLERTARTAVSAFRNGRYDPVQHHALLTATAADRGRAVDVRNTLNCVGQPMWPGRLEDVELDDVVKARTVTRFEWIDKRDVEDVNTFVYVQPGTGMSLFADTAVVSPHLIERALFAIEDLLVQAASGADDLPEMLRRTGLGTITDESRVP